jgi:predicted dehydrogenase
VSGTNPTNPPRRTFLKQTTGAAALTTSLFTGNLKGANDKIRIGFIGLGQMGRSNLHFAMQQPEVEVAALCDVYQPCLDIAAKQAGPGPKPLRDFHQILDDRSIDAVCIATPDHWHPYLTVEACKAGKDVYVEKPISVTVDEGQKMVEAARKHKRVVQTGTMQRSAEHFQKAVEIVKSGQLGKITMAHTWNYGHMDQEGIGNPQDSAPPPGLDWDMWLGPAAKREFNLNRFGYDIERPEKPRWFSHFRWFWDYAGGMMTDWGVHLLDIVQWAMNEEQPNVITALGGKWYLKDNRETPDTLKVIYEYPSGFIATYENRNNNGQSLIGKGYGILLYGSNGTMFIDRSEYFVLPEMKAERLSEAKKPEVKTPLMQGTSMPRVSGGNFNHWKNFVSCIRSREKPVSDIEVCHKSTATCLLGNVALRTGQRLEFDAAKQTITDSKLQKWLTREYRKPWKLSV